MKNTTKLDSYDYLLDCEMGIVTAVIIAVDGPSDVTIADISSEINSTGDRIYVDGHYLMHKNISIITEYGKTKMVIDVYEI